MSKPSHSFRPDVLQLESREVPAITSVRSLGGIVTAQANDSGTTVLVVNNGFTVQVRDVAAGRVWTFDASRVGRVDVIGGNGNDTITARGNGRVRMHGNGGNDTFYGGTGRDIMFGGAGADRMFGRNGNDYADGGDGNDYIDGGNGNDTLFGGAGRDQVNGGMGVDALDGGTGEDVLVAIDDATLDTVDGGGGRDIAWLDQVGIATDAKFDLDFVNAVTAFANAGADRTINGDRIPDPALLPNKTDVYERFTDRPLFSSQGPSEEDLSQGQLGDCWFLSALGSSAHLDQNIIRERVVDFGDGTYGVRFGNTFYRVDNDLPVRIAGNTQLEYTAVGIENSMWVAVMEKAFTHHRVPGANSYASIEGGFAFDAFADLGLDPKRVAFDPSTSLLLMSDTIRHMVDTGTAATIGIFIAGPGVPLVEGHQFILLGYELDAISGLVANVTLRNPWGVDGPGPGPGPFNDPNFEDGILTITLDQLSVSDGLFEWGERPVPV